MTLRVAVPVDPGPPPMAHRGSPEHVASGTGPVFVEVWVGVELRHLHSVCPGSSDPQRLLRIFLFPLHFRIVDHPVDRQQGELSSSQLVLHEPKCNGSPLRTGEGSNEGTPDTLPESFGGQRPNFEVGDKVIHSGNSCCTLCLLRVPSTDFCVLWRCDSYI